MSLGLTQEQLAAVQLPPELVVSASAGSGKTEVLVRRVLAAALEQGIPLDRMLIVTFTRAAAAELRERLRKSFTGLRSRPGEVRAHLAALDRAQISTIHSFCLDIVQRYGYLRGLGAQRILPDDEARLLRHELAGELLRTRLDSAGADLRHAALAWGGADGVGADDLSATRSTGGLRDILLRLYDFRRSLPDAAGWQARHLGWQALDPEHCDPAHPLVNAALQPLQHWARELSGASRALLEELRAQGIGPHATALHLRRCAALERLAGATTWDELPGAFAALDECLDLPYRPKGLLANYGRDVDDPALKERIKLLAEAAQKDVKELRAFYGEPWREVALRENETRTRLLALWSLADEFDALYTARKRERGAVDYADLESGALSLLRENGIAGELQTQLDFVLVDEYQDTSPIQDAVLELVTPPGRAGSPEAGAKSRFIVGDLKQSIYAFRLAEPSLFSAHQQRLGGADSAGSALKLTGSFRSRGKVIAAINQIFDGLLDAELGGEDYAQNRLTPALDYRALCGAGFTEDAPARLHLVEVPRGHTVPAADDADSEDDEAGASQSFSPAYARVASILAAMRGAGQTVYDKALGTTRPADWRDMAVLLRTSRGRVEALRRELDRAGIPSYAPGRSGFYERPEVSDALSLLAVVDNPRQDIPLAAVLTGPAVGLSPVDLARIALGSSATLADELDPGFGNTDFYARLERYIAHGADAALQAKLADFLQRLSQWQQFARREPLDDLLHMLYRASGLQAAAAALKNGRQRLANLSALSDRVRQFGQFDRQGLSRFLEYIAASRRAAGDSGEAPLLSDKEDVVRVLTVHQAKGLEFPIVVVPDLERRFNLPELGDDVQWHFRAGIGARHYDLAAYRRCDTLARRGVRAARRLAAVSEELRILYVALTRARERLELVATVEPGSRDRLTRPRGVDAQCWLHWVAPQLGDAVSAGAAGQPQACGAESCWEVHCTPATPTAIVAERPGAQISSADATAVLARLQTAYAFPGSAQLPAKVTVTQLSETALDSDAERAVPLGEARTGPGEMQPSFLAAQTVSASDVGIAAHRILAAIDPREFARFADIRAVEQLRGALVRHGQLSRLHAEHTSLAQLSQCAADLAAALPRLLRTPFQHFAELPVSLLVPARELAQHAGGDPDTVGEELVHVQGAIDLLLDDGATVLVLDYKTGYTADPLELRRIHAQQLEWYCRAAAMLLPGRRIRWTLYGLGGAGLLGPVDYVPRP